MRFVRRGIPVLCVSIVALLVACTGEPLTGPVDREDPVEEPSSSSSSSLAEVVCEVELRAVPPTLGCASSEGDEGELAGGVSAVILGGQGENVTLASANETLSSGTFSADVTVQNLIGQALATTDGATADAEGVRVFFDQEPVATAGSGTVVVANADGTATFTASGQPFFRYDGALLGADGLLSTDETSGAKTWQFTVDATVDSFRFFLLVDGAVEFPEGWVEVTPTEADLAVGETEQLEATALDVTGDPSGASIGWSSSDEGVATVDGAGLVTGEGGGSATITASSSGPEADGEAVITVTSASFTKTWTGAVSTDWSDGDNWDPVGVPTTSDHAFVPSAPSNQPVLSTSVSVGSLTVADGATVDVGAHTLTVEGDLDAGASIIGTGLVKMTGSGVTVEGTVPNFEAEGGDVTLTGNTTASGDVFTDNNGTLDLNGQTLDVAGDFTIPQGDGELVMTDANDHLIVDGNAFFGDDSQITAGTAEFRGDFTVRQFFNAYAASTGHTTILNGTVQQTVDTEFIGTSRNHFGQLEIDNAAGVAFARNALALGDVVVNAGNLTETASSTLTTGGSFTTPADVTLTGLSVDDVLTFGGTTYSVGTTTFTGTGQTVPDLTYTSVTVTGSGAQTTAALGLGGALTVSGSSADLTLGAGAAVTGGVFLSGGTLTLGGTTTVGGNVGFNNGTLDLNGQTLDVAGDFTIPQGDGELVMTDANDHLIVDGNAFFGDDSQFTAGTAEFRGDFTVRQFFNAYAASTGHTTIFNGTAQQTVDVEFTRSDRNHFGQLEIDNAAGVAFARSALVIGQLTIGTGVSPTLSGSGNTLTVDGLNVDGATLDHLLLVVSADASTDALNLDNVTFQNYATSATQLAITHPGAASAFGLDNNTFDVLSGSDTGLYLDVDDSDDGGDVLTLNVSDDPGNGPGFTNTDATAVVNWSP